MSAAPKILRDPPAYRVLILSPDGGVSEIHALIAADDDEAIALAKAMMHGNAVELWDGLRFIDHYDPLETVA